MKTIILPGFSLNNKAWAEEIRDSLNNAGLNAEVVNWPHWETGKAEADWIPKEAEKLAAMIGGEAVNILAKSIGTVVTMQFLQQNSGLVNKLILCGLPMKVFAPSEESNVDLRPSYDILADFPTDKLFVVQNDHDPLGGFAEVEQFLHTKNQTINIISKSRDDHAYPFPEDFIGFLK